MDKQERKIADIRINRETFRNEITMRDYMAIVEGNPRAITRVLSAYAYDESGEQIPQPEAAELLADMSVAQFEDLASQIMTKMNDAAAPLASGQG